MQERPPCIPESVLKKRAAMATADPQLPDDDAVAMDTEDPKKTERDIELEMDDEYVLDLQSKYSCSVSRHEKISTHVCCSDDRHSVISYFIESVANRSKVSAP